MGNRNGKSSRENGYYGPSDLDLTVGAVLMLAGLVAVVAICAAAKLLC